MKTTKKFLLCVALPSIAMLCSLDTAQAQNATLTANPPQLTFNTQNGPGPASQTVAISSSISPVSITVTAYSDSGWLQVTPASGATPIALTVSIGSGGPVSGTDVGFINVSGPGSSSVTIPVTLNANSNGTTSLSATPNALSFNFASGSTVPSTQTVTITSSTSGVTSYTATPIMDQGGTWLTAVPTSGSVPGSIQVTVNPGVITGSGTFNGAIAINPPGTNGVSVPVLVTIAGTPALNVTPSQLSFAFQIGQSGPAAQTLTVSSSTGANVSFTASAQTTSCGSNWLVVTPTQSATPSTLSVQINPSGLGMGNCAGTIALSAPGASNPSVTVNVTLLASTNPLLLVPSTGPTFDYQVGGTVQAAQGVQITSSSTALSFTASAAPPTGGPSFLSVNPSSGTTTQSLALGLVPSVLATLAPGTYAETVTVSSAGAGNSPQSFPVMLVVSSNPVITSSASSLNFNYQVGQAQPQSQTLTLSSSGTPLAYQVFTSTTNCNGFLTATPANGNTFGNTNQVVVSVVTTGLTTSQVCNGTLSAIVPGSTAAPLTIPVTLIVSTTPLIDVSQSSINVTALAGASPAQQSISLTSTNSGVSLPFSATAATNPPGLTWLSVTPNSGSTPSNLLITINPSNLSVGTYPGTITISSTAPNVPAQTISVTLTVVASNATATPANGLAFTQTVGAAAPPSQMVQIGGVPTGATIGVGTTTLNGSGWLSAGAAGNTVTVTTNGMSLPQGSYAGVVTVFVPGAGNSPLSIPVTLTVGAAPTLSVSTASVNLTAQLGSTINGSATVGVTSSGTNVPFTAMFTPVTGGAFATVTPASGTAPATLTIALNSTVVSTLAAGTYSGTVTVASPNIAGGNKTVTVNLTVSAAATPVLNAITNGASLQATNSVSPGEIISIFGTNLGPVTPVGLTLTASGTVPTTAGGTTVLFGSVAAPLIYVSATQINAIVPYQVASGTSSVVTVQTNGSTSMTFQVQIVPTAPAIFSTTMTGSGQGAILNQNSSVNSAANPAAVGSVIQIFATGEGQIVPAGTTGCVTPGTSPFAVPIANVTVAIGGLPAVTQYVGEAPALVCGVLQINALVPTGVGAGAQSLVLTVGSVTNTGQNITVQVQ